MISKLILKCWEKDYSAAIYNGAVYLGLAAQILSLIFYRKPFGFSLKKSIFLYIAIYPVLFLWMYFVTWVELDFHYWGSKNILRVYMWVPLILLLYSKLLRIPCGKLCDYFAPGVALAAALGHAGCPFVGCCYGYPFRYGIYNPVLRQRLFPIQWVECATSLAISIFLLVYTKKKGYECKGKAMALFLILFGSTRFFFEFLRDNTKLFWGISELAIWAFLTFVTGIVMMLLIFRSEKENSRRPLPESGS